MTNEENFNSDDNLPDLIDLDADKKFKFWLKLAKENRQKREWDKALKCYDRALDIEPKNDRIYFNIATIYFKQGEIERSVENFQKCLKLNPKFIGAHTRIGVIYRNMKENDKAREHFLSALELDQFSEIAREGIAAIYIERKEFESAEKHYYFLVNYVDKKNAIAWNNLSWIYYISERYNEGIKAAKKALKYQKNFENALDTLGSCYIGIGNTKQAAKQYKKLLKLNPNALKDGTINKKAFEAIRNLI